MGCCCCFCFMENWKASLKFKVWGVRHIVVNSKPIIREAHKNWQQMFALCHILAWFKKPRRKKNMTQRKYIFVSSRRSWSFLSLHFLEIIQKDRWDDSILESHHWLNSLTHSLSLLKMLSSDYFPSISLTCSLPMLVHKANIAHNTKFRNEKIK